MIAELFDDIKSFEHNNRCITHISVLFPEPAMTPENHQWKGHDDSWMNVRLPWISKNHIAVPPW
jgi:hypothetical protein